ncbi:uncharacterized protein CLAFUR5_04628 [Fulvia fulva]|uniref:Uncharacterized protein n=1 Tax=Passalora fulva TaxID=5499 RepID=A0A9Q8LH10_PASFU|nr:uncharacterized protein CLAFUR5_04628 [Fulvia fulva]KAK4627962.1 hypothetical protein CLAFUR0_04657 [Fulvia fulva]UJO16478.1 hypothetical protein CLAFUR5_04628 [Fulvia fulva]WPV28636.1 hypothetical protein CLAFUW7_04661 [Fulvia fulva]
MADQVVKPANMNYSNMIEEKNLKKGFIVATLISTIVGTFTASMTLHDKIAERRDKKKQQGIDGGQNTEIKQLKEQVAALKVGEAPKDEKAAGGEKAGEDKKSASADDKKSQAAGDGKKSEANVDAKKSQAGGGEGKSQVGGEKKSQAPNDAKSQHPRSRSSSKSSKGRRRRRDSLDADQDFARVANQSKNVIEQTFKDNVQRLGPEYAEGDLTTVNALQSQILEQQKTVIGILQTAVSEGRELTEDDKRRLIAAQNAATNGSLDALQGQYERMAAEKDAPPAPKSVAPPKSFVPPIVAPPTVAKTAVPPPGTAVNKPWESDPLPPPTEDRRRSSNYGRNAAIAGGLAAAAGAGAYAANRDGKREADRAYSDDGPPRRRPAPEDRRRSSLRPSEQPLPPAHDERPRRQEYSPPRWDDGRSSTKPRDRQRSSGDDRRSMMTRRGGQRDYVDDRRSSFRPRDQDCDFVPRKPSSDPMTARNRPPDDRRPSMKPQDPGPPPARPKSVAPNTAAPTAKATTIPAADPSNQAKSIAPKTPAPTAKATTIPPAKPPGGTVKETAAKQQDEAIRPSAIESPPRSSNHSSQRSKHSVRGSPPPPKSKMKALPAPDAPLFCRYAQDLQRHGLPLHKTFKPGGPHCCPSCNLIIPVDTRDIWVFSTHIPPQQKGDKPRTRDYRMDSRFVVKCHDGQGRFACVLCDKNRDLDCICKNVESLIKHLGSAHTFEEFDQDPDLVKMKNGSVVEMKGGKELVLA